MGVTSTAVAGRSARALALLVIAGILLIAGCTTPDPNDPSASPVGRYRVTGYVDRSTSAFVAPVAGSSITLVFEAGGRVTGTACNHYGASWSAQGDRITIKDGHSTDMACLGEGLMEQEQSYLVALEAATRWQREGSTLTLASGEGRGRVLVTAEALATHLG